MILTVNKKNAKSEQRPLLAYEPPNGVLGYTSMLDKWSAIQHDGDRISTPTV